MNSKDLFKKNCNNVEVYCQFNASLPHKSLKKEEKTLNLKLLNGSIKTKAPAQIMMTATLQNQCRSSQSSSSRSTFHTLFLSFSAKLIYLLLTFSPSLLLFYIILCFHSFKNFQWDVLNKWALREREREREREEGVDIAVNS